MGWRLYQASIAFAVLAANEYWGWMENGYAAGILALNACLLGTYLVIWTQDLLRRKRGPLVRHQRGDNSSQRGIAARHSGRKLVR